LIHINLDELFTCSIKNYLVFFTTAVFLAGRETVETYYRLFTVGLACLIVACATIPTTSSVNPWEYPNRRFSIPLGAEQDRFIAALQPCTEYANATFPDALNRYEGGQLKGAGLIAKVIDDEKFYAWIRVHVGEGDLINGQIAGQHIINGKPYAAGSRISVKKSDIVDWYIIHKDRPPEGNFIGKYMLLKQDGLAPGDCDPFDIEFQRYRYFSMSYSLVPPGTAGWELKGPDEHADMSLQKKDKNLDEVNTFSSSLYRVETNKSDQELVESARNLGRYGDEEGVRYNVVKLEAEIYPHRQARCAKSMHIVEDKKALLSKSGKRGLMIREVESLVCVHPADNGVAVVLIYSHRHHLSKRDPEFNDKASRVFESLAFTKKN
jgi:hypothetical protein